MRTISAALVLTVALFGCAGQSQVAQLTMIGIAPVLKIGSPAPDFTAKTLDGNAVSLHDYRGKVLLVLFATTWCGPCQAETADVIRLYRQLHSGRVAFLRVDPEEKEPLVRAFAMEYGEPYPVALDESGSIANLGYDKGRAFPTTYVIDPNGIVRGSFLRTYQFNDYIRAASNGQTFVARPSPMVQALEEKIQPRHFHFGGNEATVLAQIKNAQAAMDAANAKLPPNTDYHQFEKSTQALYDAMIAALEPVARSRAGTIQLYTLKIARDSNMPMGGGIPYFRDKLKWAKKLLALEPSNESANWNVMTSLAQMHHAAQALPYAEAFEKRYPSEKTYQDLSWAYEVNNDVAKQIFWETKILQIDEQKAAQVPADASLTTLEEQARVVAMGDAKLGRQAEARRLYGLALATIARIKHQSKYLALDIQNAQLGELALGLGGNNQSTDLMLAPWTGAPLPGSIANTIKYRLVVVGKPGSSVALEATRYANGWLPSFCTDNLCSPMRRTIAIPDAGAKIVEFQMIPNDPKAPKSSPVTVVASGSGAQATASVVSQIAPV